MNEPFLRAIAMNVYDDLPRRVYSDWLHEQGDLVRAEFIRLQCELEPIRDMYEIDRAVALHRREKELLRCHEKQWLGPMPSGWDDWQAGATVEFRRGFPDRLALPARTFLDFGRAILRLHPTIRRVVLFRVNGYGERLAACPALAGLPELELACWYADADAEAIAGSPHLKSLQVLEIWLNRLEGLDDSQLCRTMAGAVKGWPSLRELTLFDPNPETDGSGRQLTAPANEIAGRNVAVYRWGYPDVFPFAADFWYTFPGFLPNGRMAMAAEDDTTAPPSLSVITFDEDGRQTEEVIAVPFPDDLRSIPRQEWSQHKDRLKQHLIDSIGFRPGFIRIRDCKFPWDPRGWVSPHWRYEEAIGLPDTDDADAWEEQEHSRGNGGQVSSVVRDQEWIWGWDAWADKRGEVHST